MEGLFWLIIVVVIVCTLISNASNKKSPEYQRQQEQQRLATANIICPHCQTKGSVTTQLVKKKVGIHGGKATAAIFTLGVSMIGTGLSRKNRVTEAHCSNCGSTWHY